MDGDEEAFKRAEDFAVSKNLENARAENLAKLPLNVVFVTLKFIKDATSQYGWYFECGEEKTILYTGSSIAGFIANFYTQRSNFNFFRYSNVFHHIQMPKLFEFSFWISLSIVPLILTYLLATAGYSSEFSPDKFIQIISLAALLVSVLLLIGDVVKITQMPAVMRNGIISVFFLSVAGSAASIFAKDLSGVNNSLHASVHFLDRTGLKTTRNPDKSQLYCMTSFTEDRNEILGIPTDNHIAVPMIISITGYDKGRTGKPDLSFYSEFYVKSGLADIDSEDERMSIEDPSLAAQEPPGCPHRDLDQIRKQFGFGKQDAIAIFLVEPKIPSVVADAIASRHGYIVIHVIDKTNNVHIISDAQTVRFE